MPWMEMIRLKAAQGQIENATRLLAGLIKDVAEEEGLKRVRLYESTGYRSGVALSLLWDTALGPKGGSRAGLSISDLLRPFGLVEHSMWVENEIFPIFVDKPSGFR